ncbi:hypothetical protein [Enterobacter roggenkampii]|uniref:hypothetical protein n=1 Tax=Enterobacter roggenkampii TaxID=1812935 RepID=UPI0018C1F11C|nr:hypothetical protein [Enterobacter roggenkampii]MBG0662250.1 hypothetical protein [Enterobacter roggenkampii]
MTNSNIAQVDHQLSQIEDALGEYAAPLPQIDNIAIVREQAINLLDQATALDADAVQLREQRAGQHDDTTLLERQLATVVALVEEGKACLRSGEPVRPECAMAPSLIPEVENELSSAQLLLAATDTQIAAIEQRAFLLRRQCEDLLTKTSRAARVAHVQAMLDSATQQAAELGLELANSNQYTTAIRVDSRLAVLGRNNGVLISLKNYQGSAR